VRWSQESLKGINKLRGEGRAQDTTPFLGAAPMPAIESEKAFQAAIVAEARKLGWLTWSCTISRKSQAGWPDITLIRGNRIIFAELKYATDPTAAQLTYGEALAAVGGNVEYKLWRPEHWAEIMESLR
jgi:hypothetical protein